MKILEKLEESDSIEYILSIEQELRERKSDLEQLEAALGLINEKISKGAERSDIVRPPKEIQWILIKEREVLEELIAEIKRKDIETSELNKHKLVDLLRKITVPLQGSGNDIREIYDTLIMINPAGGDIPGINKKSIEDLKESFKMMRSINPDATPHRELIPFFQKLEGIISEIKGELAASSAVSVQKLEAGRLSLERLEGEEVIFFWISRTSPYLPHLQIRTQEELDVSRKSASQQEKDTFNRLTREAFFSLERDKEGRVIIPAALIEKANLGKEVVVVKRANYYEIWSSENWEKNIGTPSASSPVQTLWTQKDDQYRPAR